MRMRPAKIGSKLSGMTEEPLRHLDKTITEARAAVDEAPIMPFGDTHAPEDPEDSGGAVAQHGNAEAPDETPQEQPSGPAADSTDSEGEPVGDRRDD